MHGTELRRLNDENGSLPPPRLNGYLLESCLGFRDRNALSIAAQPKLAHLGKRLLKTRLALDKPLAPFPLSIRFANSAFSLNSAVNPRIGS